MSALETTAPADPRRQGRIRVVFRGDGKVGMLQVAGEPWGAVEWSEKRGAWCIEDTEGRCLRHASSIHGQAAAKEEAVALAEQMVRDGTFPDPEEAVARRRAAAQQERERRARRPSEIRRANERAERDRLFREYCDADSEERMAAPFYEIFAEAFDLADPSLWKSNSFAMVRPRLLIEVRAAIAKLEYELLRLRTKHRRKSPKTERELARARGILRLLDDGVLRAAPPDHDNDDETPDCGGAA
jgi:hypothetical protein